MRTFWSFLVLLLFLPACKKEETTITKPPDQQDITAPTVSIIRPVSGAVCYSVDTVLVQANDNVAVTKVELYVNSQLHATSTNSPWIFPWNTLQATDGSKQLIVKGYDAAGNVSSSSTIAVTVSNLSSITRLTQATAYTTAALPGKYSFDQQTNYWSVVGLRPPPSADFDLELHDDSLYSTLLGSSAEAAGVVDFIVGDHNHSPLGVHYPKVVQYSGTGTYSIEWEDGNDQLAVPTTTGSLNWGSTTIVKVWDASLTAGTQYTFALNVLSGTVNFGIALFKSNGAAYYAKRGTGGPVAVADANGNGQGETLTYIASSTDWYGFVVWSNNAAGGSFTLHTSQ